ncbi:carboxylase [Longispora fulva]|uniref:Biotin carboxylase n=1 Tax=Longispora fulva TaxID=619741 RepID=A0A8J7GCZ9_9ACTN|nr:ATP-grasp domain-containing protein [Longispora fulva]MBG6134167.1 biotin carboxylase [Longispora fulva]GIG62540.1 carboxylase [Longispora fulva]
MSPHTHGASERPLLVVVSSLGQSTREPFLASLAGHYRVWLFIGGPGRADEPSWEVPYLTGHTVVDTLDADAMLAAAQKLAAEETITGILTYDEARVVPTAVVATALGLPTSEPEAFARCRDKTASREALAACGVPQATSVSVRSLDHAREVAAELGYPVVVKPRHLATSIAVIRADSPADLEVAYDAARSATLPETPAYYEFGVLVEEFLDGYEISVDSACFDGRVVPLAVARKATGYAPSFEETGHVVDGRVDWAADDELMDVLVRAHAAVGLHTGTSHVELKYTSSGLKVVEINARLGGDLVPYLGQLATGVDLSLAAAAIATGAPVDLERTESRVAAIRFYYPATEVTVRSVDFDRSLLPAGTERAVPLAQPGQEMLLPPRGFGWMSRLAHVVVVAPDTETAAAALDAAAGALLVVTEESTL